MRGQASFSEGLNVGMERLIDRRSRKWDDARLDNLAPYRVGYADDRDQATTGCCIRQSSISVGPIL